MHSTTAEFRLLAATLFHEHRSRCSSLEEVIFRKFFRTKSIRTDPLPTDHTGQEKVVGKVLNNDSAGSPRSLVRLLFNSCSLIAISARPSFSSVDVPTMADQIAERTSNYLDFSQETSEKRWGVGSMMACSSPSLASSHIERSVSISVSLFASSRRHLP